MAKKLKTKKELIPNKFVPGDKVYLIPNSLDGRYEYFDMTSDNWEDLNPDYEYEVEHVQTMYTKKVEASVSYPYREKPMSYLSLVHTYVCGGSGYQIPAYRFWTKKEYLAQKKKLPSSKK